VVDDVDQLIGGQADVQGVQDGAHTGGGEVDLQVAVGVPGEGGHPIAPPDPQPGQGVGQAVNPSMEVGVGVAVHAGGGAGGDLLAGEETGGAVQEMMQGERPVHHQAFHGTLLSG
jgi:hypothetical protein